ncbi:MAG TPA: NAD-glutamate dehydrogenase [Thermoanaerobaculia bacterium]|nr:NAD-glutamate dehydrogenase [Thermoanaerobaculia bacterium]
MTITAEQRRVDLVDRLAAEAKRRVPADQAQSAEHFVRRYFAHVAPDDVIYTSFDTLLGAALSLWEFGVQRQPGVPKIRLFNPTAETSGWETQHTVVEIVNDDMPFLVDSITAELNRRDRKIHLLLHPVIRSRRDASGNRLEITDTAHAPTDAIVESYMHVEIDQETEVAELESMRASLQLILDRVRMAVTDWRAMRQHLADDLEEMDPAKLPMLPEEVEEAKAFLRWLDNGHFIFLGHRRYTFETRDGADYLKPLPETGLGISRDIRPETIESAQLPLKKADSDYARRKDLVIITKANRRSLIHRPVPMDRIGIKRYNEKGDLIGEDRFLGLFTSAAYQRSVRDIPMLRLKATRALDRAGLDPHSHNGKAFADILETFPRDEFFQITDADLFDVARGILLLQERQRVALFTRKDLFERFVSCYVFVPRDRYTAEFKERARAILEEAFAGRDTQVYDHIGTSPLARGLFIVRTTPGNVPDADVRRVEAFLAEAARTWSDRLLDTLVQEMGEEVGIDLHHRYKKAFPMAYSERFSASAALFDVGHVEHVLATGELVVDLYRHRSEERQFHCKIIHAGPPVPLSEIMPRLENMGLKVLAEVPYEVQPLGAPLPVRIRDFSLDGEGMQDDLTPVKEKFQDAFIRVWTHQAENDGFNRLVLGADVEWHEVVVLRAYAKYLRQVGVALSETYIQQTLAKHPAITRNILQLFRNYFDPAIGDVGLGRKGASLGIRSQIEDALERVTNPDEDRILRLYVSLIEATLRTNYFQVEDRQSCLSTANGQAGLPVPHERRLYLSFKLDSSLVPELPLPRPMFEIFVYAPWMEGIHLRGGKVARGGIRWSDRREDFRTEILGLMKAQMVKNVVIVPVGSKGGFVVKNPSADRAAFQQEGVESYKTLLRGMLDITDNLRGDEVIPPRDVVRRDQNDPYLVVAADKGTATFSDIANSVSAEYGFWLGDAFASGGSAGYDHKKMGITARGGWEAVKRHFRELGVDTQSEDFTVAGVGDMAGDVFGNAMLLSPHVKLIGVFNYSHIFVDPNPDPTISFAERQRLFDNRLNWNGYNTELLSKGGAVYERSAKTITLSDEVQRRFELPKKVVAPVELMRAILRANADLLWLGGIGTYVKASWEDHAAARDRANDPLRINANELRVRVVGEGANLGFTQRGRIEYAHGGGKINTDAIDNSAGVDTSDHEVNIKIALNDAIERGELSGIEERNRILAEMTDDVGRLVLRDNYEQTQAISVTHTMGESLLDTQARFMRGLEKQGKLDRAIEGLPDDETIADRHTQGIGLTRPEIAVLLAYAKLVLYEDLLKSDLPDDPQLVGDLVLYFPDDLRARFRGAIDRHKLRREIIATVVNNAMINRVRPTFAWQMCDETGKAPADIARAFIIMRDAFDLRTVWSEIEALDNKLPASVQLEMMISVARLLERAILWLLRSGYEKLDIAAYVAEFRPRIAAIQDHLVQILPASMLATVRVREAELVVDGIPEELARRVASLDVMTSAMDIVRIARADADHGVEDVARVYFGVGARLNLDRLRTASAGIAAETPWQKSALAALVDDLFNYQSTLAARVITETNGAPEPVDAWLAARPRVVERIDQTMHELRAASAVDLAMLSVASRQLRALVES